jgi:LysR family cys regulon transcriptional activator
MNLRQLRYITEIARRDLNISAVAAALHTSQPGISKQVKLLESELGVDVFVRARNRLSGITPEGARIIAYAQSALDEVANIAAVSVERKRPTTGTLTVATTHTQARYVLPEVMKAFAARNPKVRMTLLHGDPSRIAELVASGEADIGVTTDAPRAAKELLVLPVRKFQRVVIVPRGHRLLRMSRLTLKALAQNPLITYEPQFTGRREVVRAFEREGLSPTLFVSAIDADVIKTCVEQGLGIAVLSEVTFDPVKDAALRAIPAAHLFEASTTSLLLQRKRYLQQYAYDFIETCAPAWAKARVQRAAATHA